MSGKNQGSIIDLDWCLWLTHEHEDLSQLWIFEKR